MVLCFALVISDLFEVLFEMLFREFLLSTDETSGDATVILYCAVQFPECEGLSK